MNTSPMNKIRYKYQIFKSSEVLSRHSKPLTPSNPIFQALHKYQTHRPIQ